MSRGITSYFARSPPKEKPTISPPLLVQKNNLQTTSTTEQTEFSDDDIELDEETLRKIEENRKAAQNKRKRRELTGVEANLRDESWLDLLESEFSKPYFKELNRQLQNEKQQKFIVYPPDHLIFNALNSCPFSSVSVVILGQDPYHGAGQAHGLSFSVQKGIKVPPSLVNIYKELESDPEIKFKIPRHGNLQQWCNQGVLLLNATLTVRAKTPNSHSAFGWGQFTDHIISTLSSKGSGIVFILWGKFASMKSSLIDKKKHKVLTSAHPSPHSVANFFGNRHFSKANLYLRSIGRKEIRWQIDDNYDPSQHNSNNNNNNNNKNNIQETTNHGPTKRKLDIASPIQTDTSLLYNKKQKLEEDAKSDNTTGKAFDESDNNNNNDNNNCETESSNSAGLNKIEPDGSDDYFKVGDISLMIRNQWYHLAIKNLPKERSPSVFLNYVENKEDDVILGCSGDDITKEFSNQIADSCCSDIVVTTAGSLPYEHIYHSILPSPVNEATIDMVVWDTLSLANTNSQHSVVVSSDVFGEVKKGLSYLVKAIAKFAIECEDLHIKYIYILTQNSVDVVYELKRLFSKFSSS